MNTVVKAVLIGGGVGAVVAGLQSLAREEPDDVMVSNAVQAGVRGAVVGGVIGLVVSRRSPRPASVDGAEVMLSAASAARPHVEEALDAARHSARATRAGAHEAWVEARPHVQHAAELARERAHEAAEQARPRVRHAAELARERAQEAAEQARSRRAAA